MQADAFTPLLTPLQVLRDAVQFTPQAPRQPPVAVSPEETWRAKGLPADFEPAGTQSASASPAGKRRGGGSASPAAKRRRNAPAAPSQRQLTLLELSERASSPGKATRSVKIALMHAERKLGDGKPPNPKLAGEATEIMGAAQPPRRVTSLPKTQVSRPDRTRASERRAFLALEGRNGSPFTLPAVHQPPCASR